MPKRLQRRVVLILGGLTLPFLLAPFFWSSKRYLSWSFRAPLNILRDTCEVISCPYNFVFTQFLMATMALRFLGRADLLLWTVFLATESVPDSESLSGDSSMGLERVFIGMVEEESLVVMVEEMEVGWWMAWRTTYFGCCNSWLAIPSGTVQN